MPNKVKKVTRFINNVSHVGIEYVFVFRKDIGLAIDCDHLSNVRSVDSD